MPTYWAANSLRTPDPGPMAAMQHPALDNSILLGSLEPVNVLSCLDQKFQETSRLTVALKDWKTWGVPVKSYDDSATATPTLAPMKAPLSISPHDSHPLGNSSHSITAGVSCCSADGYTT